ncbi:DUF1254 domain-containing protein [Nocardia vinacea]|uniref:DUF1254 domain-containing protein n=1 Tax=Nocardia vinacea TaxID=96468 RepID=UPI0033EDCE6F
MNTLGHQRRLSDPTLTRSVAPNVDTLYSLTFLDLACGEFRLRLPNFGRRYYSIQIGEADSSTAAVFGQRTTGTQTPDVVIRRADRGTVVDSNSAAVACRSRFVMLAVRILVDPHDPIDLRAVHDLQDRIELIRPCDGSATTSPSLATRDRTPAERIPRFADPRHRGTARGRHPRLGNQCNGECPLSMRLSWTQLP